MSVSTTAFDILDTIRGTLTSRVDGGMFVHTDSVVIGQLAEEMNYPAISVVEVECGEPEHTSGYADRVQRIEITLANPVNITNPRAGYEDLLAGACGIEELMRGLALETRVPGVVLHNYHGRKYRAWWQNSDTLLEGYVFTLEVTFNESFV